MPDEQAEPEDTAIPGEIEADHGGFGLQAGNREQGGIWQPRHVVREHDDARGLPQARFKPISQRFEADGIALQRRHRGLRRGAEAGNARDVLGPGPAPQFLAAAAQQWLEAQQPSARTNGADALGAADLVRRKRHQIGTHHTDIESYFTERLDRVDMQQAAGGMDDLGRLRAPAASRRFRCWPA